MDFKKIIVLILCALIMVSTSFTGCNGDKSGKPASEIQEKISEKITPAVLTAADDEKLFLNPDRGYRSELVIMVERTKQPDVKYDPRTVFVNGSEEQIRREIEGIFNIYINKHKGDNRANLALAYIYITPWREKELDDNILNFFKIYFTMCREYKVKNMLRVSYCTSTANLDEGADQQTIVRHTKQLKDVISEYSDTIHTISSGFVGAYGEWAEVYQHPKVDYETVIKAIIENLAVPNNLYFSIRSPKYKNLVGNDYKYYWYISHNNDAMFGYQTKGWNSDGYEVGTAEWEQVTKEAAYTPQDGEMFVNNNLFETGRVPSGMEILLECYYHRHSSMSFWHGYLDAAGEESVMKRWKEDETITAAELDLNNVIYDPNWFLKPDGTAATRNPYEFIRDHLGYRIVAKDFQVEWSGNINEKINIDFTLNNYGFAAAFNMQSGFAVLDENYNIISEVGAGEPDKWYNRDPENAKSTELLSHKLSSELDAPQLTGKYYIAFYLKNTMNTFAALANDLPYENGYNILFNFEI